MANNPPSRSKKFGLILTLIIALSSIGYIFLYKQLLVLLETYISPDHFLDPQVKTSISVVYYFVMILLFVVGIYLWKLESSPWLIKIKRLIYSEPKSTFILLASSILGLFLFFNYFIWSPFDTIWEFLYHEDKVFESYTAIALFVGAGLIGITIWRLLKHPMITKWQRYLIVFLLLLFVGIILDGGEEISWGQRILGWGTSELFTSNYQDETNLHNFIQDTNWPWLYLFMALPFIFVLISAWAHSKPRLDFWSKWILPHPNLIGISFILGYTAIVTDRYELMEELLAGFVFFYSLRLFINTSPKNLPSKTTLKGSL